MPCFYRDNLCYFLLDKLNIDKLFTYILFAHAEGKRNECDSLIFKRLKWFGINFLLPQTNSAVISNNNYALKRLYNNDTDTQNTRFLPYAHT